jgi:signal transduction histidine kinase
MQKDETVDEPPTRFPVGTMGIEAMGRKHTAFDVDQILVPAFDVDIDGAITDCNRAAERLIGTTRHDLAGRPLSRVLGGVGTQTSVGQIRFVGSTTGAYVQSERGKIPVDVLVGRHDSGSIAMILFEVGEPHWPEDALAQIVHDLKSPLAVIGLEARVLSERLPNLETTAATERILRNVDFLDRMLQDLSDLCLVETNQILLRRDCCDMRVLVERVIQRVVNARDCHRVHLEGVDRALAEVDDLRIERVVANILQNALKYSAQTSKISLRLETTGSRCVLSVVDSGPGLTADEVAFIFEKYRRGSAAKHDREGSGLGLFISKRIVEAHGGSIGVESVRGMGTRFFIELPMLEVGRIDPEAERSGFDDDAEKPAIDFDAIGNEH